MSKSSDLICSKCKKKKNFGDFHKDLHKKSGRKSACKECCREFGRKHHKKLSAEERKNRHLLSNYGITLIEWNYLYNKQKGRCKICFSRLLDKRRTHLDHDHKTGKVRGILCQDCNHLLGNAKEDIKILRAAIKYLQRKTTKSSTLP